MAIAPPPEREQLEREIHDLVNGDLSDLARLLQIHASTASNAFNPYREDKHNPVYQFLLHLWAFDCIREGLSDELLMIVCREREKWLPVAPLPVNTATLTADVGIQFSEFVEARLKGKTSDEQIKEANDIVAAATRLQGELIRERNGYNGNGRPVSYETRDIVREHPAVRERKAR